MPEEMNQVIEDSLNDALEPTDVASPDTSATDDTTDASVDTTEVTSESTDAAVADSSTTTDPSHPEDPFAKEFGLAPLSVTGRENRIPYSRVKKIVATAQKKAVEAAKREWETGSTPKLQEFETKVRDYETRLQSVAQFEHIMENDPRTFLSMLSQLPGYRDFFAYIEQLTTGSSTEQAVQPNDPDSMPQPSSADGYTQDDVKKLLEWQERRIIAQSEDRFSRRIRPFEEREAALEHQRRVVPVIQQQIAEARKLPLFNESEEEIIKVLQADKRLTLEQAYQKVVIPKLAVERSRVRQEVLDEIRKKPATTATPTNQVRPSPTISNQPRSLDDVIREAIAGLK